MLNNNRRQLVCQSVIGEITSPVIGPNPYRITPDGQAAIFQGVGGITYNFRIGDPVVGLYGDHIEPGVSISNFTQFHGQPAPNMALNLFSCAGNIARVVTGDAKGKCGRVTGKHGGIDHVLIDFEPHILEQLVIGDKIQIKAFGNGLQFFDYPGIKLLNLDPDLVAAMDITELEDGRLEIPVTHTVPAKIMGSGIGAMQSQSGDYDIQLFDLPTVEDYGLNSLRFGDFVAVIDADATYGRIYRQGSIVIGIIVHSSCVIAGHGPGLMVVMTSRDGLLVPKIAPGANLQKLFNKMPKLPA